MSKLITTNKSSIKTESHANKVHNDTPPLLLLLYYVYLKIVLLKLSYRKIYLYVKKVALITKPFPFPCVHLLSQDFLFKNN